MSFNSEGMFCWADMGSTNVEASKKFYTDMFGWTWDDAGNDYWIAKMGKSMVAGLMKSQCPDGKSYWSTYLNTADLDTTMATAEKNGATTIVPKTEVGDWGWFSMHKDPTNAMIAFWQNKGDAPTESWTKNETGHMCWTELITNDIDRSGSFYCNTLKYTPENMNMGEGAPAYTMFKMGDTQAAGMMAIQKEWGEVPPHWMNYIQVDSITASSAKATKLGAKICKECTEIPGMGWFSIMTDPQGGTISMFSKTK